jgi:hypothetical protein
MELPFGKKKDEISDIPELPPLDLSQVPSGPPLTGAPQRLENYEQAGLTPGAPPTQLPPAPLAPMAPPGPMAPPAMPVPPPPAPLPYPEAPLPPAPPGAPSATHVTLMTQDVEKIAEDIIDEKWTKLVGEMNEIKNWKDTAAKQMDEVKGSLSKLDSKINDVQKAILGKVGEYNQSIKDVNVELKAMSKVFEKIMPTFTDNVKRLSSIPKSRAAPKVVVPKIKVVAPRPKKVKKAPKKRGRPKKKKR